MGVLWSLALLAQMAFGEETQGNHLKRIEPLLASIEADREQLMRSLAEITGAEYDLRDHKATLKALKELPEHFRDLKDVGFPLSDDKAYRLNAFVDELEKDCRETHELALVFAGGAAKKGFSFELREDKPITFASYLNHHAAKIDALERKIADLKKLRSPDLEQAMLLERALQLKPGLQLEVDKATAAASDLAGRIEEILKGSQGQLEALRLGMTEYLAFNASIPSLPEDHRLKSEIKAGYEKLGETGDPAELKAGLDRLYGAAVKHPDAEKNPMIDQNTRLSNIKKSVEEAKQGAEAYASVFRRMPSTSEPGARWGRGSKIGQVPARRDVSDEWRESLYLALAPFHGLERSMHERLAALRRRRGLLEFAEAGVEWLRQHRETLKGRPPTAYTGPILRGCTLQKNWAEVEKCMLPRMETVLASIWVREMHDAKLLDYVGDLRLLMRYYTPMREFLDNLTQAGKAEEEIQALLSTARGRLKELADKNPDLRKALDDPNPTRDAREAMEKALDSTPELKGIRERLDRLKSDHYLNLLRGLGDAASHKAHAVFKKLVAENMAHFSWFKDGVEFLPEELGLDIEPLGGTVRKSEMNRMHGISEWPGKFQTLDGSIKRKSITVDGREVWAQQVNGMWVVREERGNGGFEMRVFDGKLNRVESVVYLPAERDRFYQQAEGRAWPQVIGRFIDGVFRPEEIRLKEGGVLSNEYKEDGGAIAEVTVRLRATPGGQERLTVYRHLGGGLFTPTTKGAWPQVQGRFSNGVFVLEAEVSSDGRTRSPTGPPQHPGSVWLVWDSRGVIGWEVDPEAVRKIQPSYRSQALKTIGRWLVDQTQGATQDKEHLQHKADSIAYFLSHLILGGRFYSKDAENPSVKVPVRQIHYRPNGALTVEERLSYENGKLAKLETKAVFDATATKFADGTTSGRGVGSGLSVYSRLLHDGGMPEEKVPFEFKVQYVGAHGYETLEAKETWDFSMWSGGELKRTVTPVRHHLGLDGATFGKGRTPGEARTEVVYQTRGFGGDLKDLGRAGFSLVGSAVSMGLSVDPTYHLAVGAWALWNGADPKKLWTYHWEAAKDMWARAGANLADAGEKASKLTSVQSVAQEEREGRGKLSVMWHVDKAMADHNQETFGIVLKTFLETSTDALLDEAIGKVDPLGIRKVLDLYLKGIKLSEHPDAAFRTLEDMLAIAKAVETVGGPLYKLTNPYTRPLRSLTVGWSANPKEMWLKSRFWEKTLAAYEKTAGRDSLWLTTDLLYKRYKTVWTIGKNVETAATGVRVADAIKNYNRYDPASVTAYEKAVANMTKALAGVPGTWHGISKSFEDMDKLEQELYGTRSGDRSGADAKPSQRKGPAVWDDGRRSRRQPLEEDPYLDFILRSKSQSKRSHATAGAPAKPNPDSQPKSDAK